MINPGLGSANSLDAIYKYNNYQNNKKTMLLDRVAKIIARTAQCKIEDIKPDTELEALGIDSLKAITVLFELEEAFDIEIPNELISSIITVNDILDKLEVAHC